MTKGDYLYFKASDDWRFYFKVLGFNEKSIKISKAVERPTEPKTIHRIMAVKGFGTRTPTFRIGGSWHLARMQLR